MDRRQPTLYATGGYGKRNYSARCQISRRLQVTQRQQWFKTGNAGVTDPLAVRVGA